MVLEDDPALGSRAGRVSLPQDSSVEFRNLTFRYARIVRLLYGALRLKSRQGSSLGVVGPTRQWQIHSCVIDRKDIPNTPRSAFCWGSGRV